MRRVTHYPTVKSLWLQTDSHNFERELELVTWNLLQLSSDSQVSKTRDKEISDDEADDEEEDKKEEEDAEKEGDEDKPKIEDVEDEVSFHSSSLFIWNHMKWISMAVWKCCYE